MVSIPELLNRVTRLCPLSASLQRVIALSGDDSAKVGEVVQALGMDAALANQVMRIANSAAFGQSRKVADLRQAVVIIGLGELHSLATGIGVMGAFRSKDAVSLQLHEQSFLAANLARRLARGLPVEAGTAYLCGLLSEIGALACAAVDLAGFTDIWQQTMQSWDGHSPEAWQERARLEVRRYYGATPYIGAQLLSRNALPPRIVEAVGTTLESAAASQLVLGSITAISRVGGMVLLRCDDQPATDTGRAALGLLAEALQRMSLAEDQFMKVFAEVAGEMSRRDKTHHRG